MFRHLKRFCTLLGVGTTVLALHAFGVAPASATTIPPGSVQGFSAVNKEGPTSDNKQAQAFCPQGWRVVGGGGLVSGSLHAVIVESRPISQSGQDSYLVSAVEDQTRPTEKWVVEAYVLCAPVKPPGWEINTVNGTPTSDTVHQQPAPCSPGKVVTGTGGIVQSAGGARVGEVDLGMAPNSSGFPTISTVIAKEDADGFSGQYLLTSISICATPDFSSVDFLPDLRGAEQQSDSNPNQTKTVQVRCPDGYRLTGVSGYSSAPGTHLLFYKPTTNVSPTVAEVAATSQISGNWNVIAFAYCAR